MRNLGIDLYRIVLTFMICLLHTLGQGGLLASNGHLAEATAVLQKNLGLDDNGNVKMFDTLRDTQLDLTKVIVMELVELVQKFEIKTN